MARLIGNGSLFAGLTAGAGVVLALFCTDTAQAQEQKIIIVNTTTTGGSIDRRYAQIVPTNVSLPQQQIDARGHQDILRTLTAEQGFAMRPLPRGKKA